MSWLGLRYSIEDLRKRNNYPHLFRILKVHSILKGCTFFVQQWQRFLVSLPFIFLLVRIYVDYASLTLEETMVREVNVKLIEESIKEMCIESNHYLSSDMEEALARAIDIETSENGKIILNQLQDNLKIAAIDEIPICQDTGMVVVFIELGQDVHLIGGALEDAINEGIRQGYEEGYLRKSVVSDPLVRENTKDNTPGVIHTKIVSGDKVKITVAPKGFGSENISRIFMLSPSDGIDGVVDRVLTAVKEGGANACPPLIVGVGIGGTFEKCALISKEALLRKVGEPSAIPHIAKLEKELLDKINQLDIGPSGLGGNITALAVNIETYPTHIAGLPVAVNICCHVNRHMSFVI